MPTFCMASFAELMRKPLSEVATSPEVARRLAPLLDRHLDNLREFKQRAKLEERSFTPTWVA